MKGLFAAMVVALAGAMVACFTVPVAAQTCYSLADVKDILEMQGEEYIVLPSPDIQAFVDAVAEPSTGEQFERVTNVLIHTHQDHFDFGLEIDGCMVGPIPARGVTALPKPVKLYGRQPNGLFYL